MAEILPDVDQQIVPWSSPTPRWFNGETRLMEFGNPPPNWVLGLDGYWYPPENVGTSIPGTTIPPIIPDPTLPIDPVIPPETLVPFNNPPINDPFYPPTPNTPVGTTTTTTLPSTQTSSGIVLNPMVQLILPWKDPEKTFRATNVVQMYDTYCLLNNFKFEHDLGLSIKIPKFKVYIRNKTTNVQLNVKISIPDYLKSNNIMEVFIPANSVRFFGVEGHENFINEYAKNSITTIPANISVRVTPVNYSGPIYVRTDLKALSESI